MTVSSWPRRIALALLAVVTVLVPATATATTPPTEPAPTEAPATQPPGTEAPTDTDDGSDIPWGPILLVAGLVLALIVIVSLLSSRSSAAARRAATPQRAYPAQSSLLSTSQWVHDQLTLELMAASPASARQRWTTERTRLDNVAIGAQQQWTEGHGEAWQRLGQTTSALAGALETNIALREQADPNPQLVQESIDVVNRNRAVLQQLISALWPSVQG